MATLTQINWKKWRGANSLGPAEVRFSTRSDIRRINTAYNDACVRPEAGAKGYVKRSESQWSWEFDRLSTGNPPYVIAECGDQLIGTEAYIQIPMMQDGVRIATGKDEDTLVHPDHRGRGVLDAMYQVLLERASQENIVMLWGFTSSAIRSLLRNQFVSLGPFEAMRLSLANQKRVLAVARAGLHSACAVEELAASDERCDSFSQAFSREVSGLTLDLSAGFLEWRVFRNPFRSYQVIAATLDKQIVGMVILKFESDGRVGFISDLAAVDSPALSRQVTLTRLLDTAMMIFAERRFQFVEVRPSGMHPYNIMLRNLLSKRGFERVPIQHSPQFMVRPVVGTDKRILQMSNWRICELMREY